jgi:hypothetical protein
VRLADVSDDTRARLVTSLVGRPKSRGYIVGSPGVVEHRQIAESVTNGDPELTDQLLVQHRDDAVVFGAA